VPVAGVTGGGAPQYFTGNFGSPLTTNINNAGRYLSVGASTTGVGAVPGVITINFTNPQTSLALLWGSIDPGNTLTFMNGNTTVFTVTGVQAQAASNSLFGPNGLGNGFLGVGGSAYVIVDTTTPFTSVIATNPSPGPGNFPSFEFTGVVADEEAPFEPVIPEPSGVWVLTGAFGIMVAVVRRRDVLPG